MEKRKTKQKCHFIFQRRSFRQPMLLCMLFASLFFSTVIAQDQKISIKQTNKQLSEVLNEIESKTGFSFLVRSNDVNLKQTVSIDVTNKSVKDILQTLFKDTGINYELNGKSVSIFIPQKSTNKSSSINLSGTVNDEKGQPIIGSTIKILGTTKGTISDANGKFSLEAPSDAKIEVSYVGYITVQKEINGKQSMNIVLSENVNELDQVVVIGYGTIKKKDLTGSVSSVKMSDIKQGTPSNFVSNLQGRLAGVEVRNNSSVPGAGVSITVRGINSINGGNNPLYVIDGQPINDNTGTTHISSAYGGRESVSDLSAINPNDIETIDVLKDASATAIYGARGASGVILITTKSGKLGKPVTEFNANLGFAKPAKQYELNDAVGFIAMNNAALAGSNRPLYFKGDLVTPMYNTNWQSEIFRDLAPTKDFNLAFRGGNERLLYNISANYFEQEGMVKNSDYTRFSLKTKLENQVSTWLKLGVNMTGTHRVSNEKSNGIIGAAYGAYPIFPVLLNNIYVDRPNSQYYDLYNDATTGTSWGVSALDNSSNPMASINLASDVSTVNRFFGNTFAEITLLPGLKFKTMLGIDMDDSRYQMYNKTNGYNTVGVGFVAYSNVMDWINENTLSYVKSFNKHSINAVIGQTAERYRTDNASLRAEYLNDNTGFYTFSGDKYQDLARGKNVGGNQWSMASFLGRINYSFDSKYLLTVSMRADGSSRFGANNKWGYFPAASGAWVMSEESFMKSIKTISSLKFRAGYGITGSQEIGLYNSLATLGERNGVLNNIKAWGVVPDRIPNPDLSWEKTRQLNVGFDLGLFQNRISLNTDFYVKNTTDLLYNLPIPLTSGYSSITKNVGAVSNNGYEITLTTRNISKKDFNWTTNFIFSQNFNKVVKLRDGLTEVINGGSLLRVGEPLGTIYGYKTDGLFSVGDPLLTQQLGAFPGDRKYVDLAGTPINNPDGTKTATAPDGKINDYDRTIIGYSFPKFIASISNSISYKSIECNFLFQGSYGNKTINWDKTWLEGVGGKGNVGKVALNYWTPDNQNTNIERPTQSRSNNYGGGNNDYYMEDASYIRLRNLQIGYSLPAKIASKLSMSNLKFSVAIDNLITITKYTGLDPDSYSNYPIPRTLSIGINATL
ncbi:MAG: TonB-dependent receptor [Paludibacter sp.]|nr:TonB-dependent receptor [Paludibacter sp.]